MEKLLKENKKLKGEKELSLLCGFVLGYAESCEKLEKNERALKRKRKAMGL